MYLVNLYPCFYKQPFRFFDSETRESIIKVPEHGLSWQTLPFVNTHLTPVTWLDVPHVYGKMYTKYYYNTVLHESANVGQCYRYCRAMESQVPVGDIHSLWVFCHKHQPCQNCKGCAGVRNDCGSNFGLKMDPRACLRWLFLGPVCKVKNSKL